MTALRAKVIKDCVLVVPFLHFSGGVNYFREDISEEEAESGETVKVWQTTKTSKSKEEENEAQKLRAQMKSQLKTVCSSFTKDIYICPLERKEELDEIEANFAIAMIDFNNKTKYIKMTAASLIPVIVQSSDEKALSSLMRAMRSTLEELERSIKTGDPKMIREVLPRLKELDKITEGEASEKLKVLIDDTRKQARELTKLVKKGLSDIEINQEKDRIIDTTLVENLRSFIIIEEHKLEEKQEESGVSEIVKDSTIME